MTVEVTPAKRPEGEISALLRPDGPEACGRLPERLDWLRSHRYQARDFNLYFVRPGVVVARPPAPWGAAG